MKSQLLIALMFVSGTAVAARREAGPAPAPAVASSSGSALSLMDAYESAFKNSERMDLKAENVEQAKAQYRQARSGVLPALKWNINDTIQDTSGVQVSTTGGGVNSTLLLRERNESKFVLTQTIFSGFKEEAGLKALRYAEKEQELLFKREAALLFQEVAAAFYNVVNLQTQLEDVQVSIKLSRDRIGELRQRVQLGKSRSSEVTSAESQLAGLLAQEAQLRGEIVSAREQLSYIVAKPVQDTPLTDTVPQPTSAPELPPLLQQVENRSDVEALKEEVEGRRAGINVARSGYWPVATGTADYYTKRTGFQKNIDWDILLNLDVPIYSGGNTSALVDESKSLLRQAERSFAQLSRQAASQVRQAHAVLASSIEESRLLDDAYRKARASYESLVRDYRMGLVNNLDVLAAMNIMQTARQQADVGRLQSKLNLLNLKIAVEMSPETALQ